MSSARNTTLANVTLRVAPAPPGMSGRQRKGEFAPIYGGIVGRADL